MYQTLSDDINIILSIGGEDNLRKYPVSGFPGDTSSAIVQGYDVNQRWLRYLYILTRVQNEKMLSKGDLWVDLGSFYGGLQSIVRQEYNEVRMVMIDFHHQLARSYLFLKQIYPDKKHILPDQLMRQGLSALEPGCFAYLPASHFQAVDFEKGRFIHKFLLLARCQTTPLTNTSIASF